MIGQREWGPAGHAGAAKRSGPNQAIFGGHLAAAGNGPALALDMSSSASISQHDS